MGVSLPSQWFPDSSLWMPRNIIRMWMSLRPSQCTCFRFFLHSSSSLPWLCCLKAPSWLYKRAWPGASPKQLSMPFDWCAAVYLRWFRMKSGCKQTCRMLGMLCFGSPTLGKHVHEAEPQRTQTAGGNQIDPRNCPILSSLIENPWPFHPKPVQYDILKCNWKDWELILQWLQAVVCTAMVEKTRWQPCFIFLSWADLFSPLLAQICPERPTLLELQWQYRSMSQILPRAGGREKNVTPTDWQRRASVWKGELVWHCVWAHGKVHGCLSRERLSPGAASSRKPSFLFPIRTELKLYFGPNHLQRETTPVPTLRFRSISCHQNTPNFIISYLFQQTFQQLNNPCILLIILFC